jgi:viologen exporter family transport system permease protein
VMILAAFYSASSAPPPITLAQVVGYVWLSQATLLLIPWRTDADVREQVRTGTVAYDLCRPLDLYGVWFARALAWRTAPVLLRMLPMFVVAMVLLPAVGLPEWRLAPPPSLASGTMWLASLFGALALSCALTVLMNVSLLWTISGEGVPVLVAALATMFGGLVIPLPLYPDWSHPILYALPFPGLLDFPARIYTGQLPAGTAVWAVLHQLGWAAVLVTAGRFILDRGTRKLVIQGG